MAKKNPINTKAYRGEIITPKMRLTRAADVRGQIQVSNIVTRLTQHSEGKIDMSPTQVRAAEILLKKVLPDLQVTEMHHHDANEALTEAQMLEKLQLMLEQLDPALRAQITDAAALH